MVIGRLPFERGLAGAPAFRLAPGLRRCLRRLAFGADALEQRGCRFVVRVLRNQLARKRLLEDALPQPLGARQVRLDGRFGLRHDRQAAFHLGDDAALFGEGWEGYLLPKELRPIQDSRGLLLTSH